MGALSLLLERKRVSVLASAVFLAPLTQNHHHGKQRILWWHVLNSFSVILPFFWYNYFRDKSRIVLHALFNSFIFCLIKQHCIS